VNFEKYVLFLPEAIASGRRDWNHKKSWFQTINSRLWQPTMHRCAPNLRLTKFESYCNLFARKSIVIYRTVVNTWSQLSI